MINRSKIEINYSNKENLKETDMNDMDAFVYRFTQLMTKALGEWEASNAAKDKSG